MEPASTVLGGVGVWKIVLWLMGLGGFGIGLATVVVMCMTTPRSGKEWAVALISTFVSSIALGGAAVIWLGLHKLFHTSDVYQLSAAMAIVGGLLFFCGLPGWTVVRWIFRAFRKREDKDILDVMQEVRSITKGGGA